MFEVDQAIALCGGDVRAALRATLVANAYLEGQVERLTEAISSGFARETIVPNCTSRLGQAATPGHDVNQLVSRLSKHCEDIIGAKAARSSFQALCRA